MEIRVIWSKRLTSLQEDVNRVLEGIPPERILDQNVYFPRGSLGDPIVVILWLKSKKGEAS